MRISNLLILIFLGSSSLAKAEDLLDLNIEAEGMIDTYYSHNFDSQKSASKQFFTQSLKDDKYNLNLAYFGVAAENENFHGKLSLQYGNSVDANYSAETYDSLKYLQEAFIGYNLNEKLRIDVGIYFSHIGLESFISKNNSAYTRSLVSEFSPYYQSGVRIEYQLSESILTQLHLLNGWQNVSTDKLQPAIGTQVVFGKSNHTQVSYNTFFGNENDGFRTLQDIVVTVPLHESLDISGAIDWGFEDSDINESGDWYGFLFLADFWVLENLSFITRFEGYSDTDSIIVISENGQAFKTNSYSVGFNYEPQENILIRTEYKSLMSSNLIFKKDDSTYTKNDSYLIGSLSIFF